MIDLATFVTNLIFSIINVFLLEYYLKNLYSLQIISNIVIYYILELIFAILMNYMFYNNFILSLLLFVCTISISTVKFKIRIYDIIKTILFFVLLNTFLRGILNITFEQIFCTIISTQEFHIMFSYSILVRFIEGYLNLIIITYLCVHKKGNYIPLHYFKVISYALSIYFGITILLTNDKLFYFPSIGRTFTFIIIVYNIALIVFDKCQTKYYNLKYKVDFQKQLFDAHKTATRTDREKVDKIVRIKHDSKNNYYIVRSHIEHDEKQKALSFIDKLIGKIEEIKFCIHLGDSGIDAIIDRKIHEMKKREICYCEEALNVNLDYFDCDEIALLVSLALDNAIEACEKVEGHKEIELSAKSVNDHLILHIKNSIVPGSKPKFHKTSKLRNREWHGLGVGQMKEIVKMYDGDMDYEVHDNYVELIITLKGQEIKKEINQFTFENIFA